MFEDIPSSLLMYTFEFLTMRDINSVIKSCKRFSQIVNDHNEFWARECLRQYLSFELDPYCELYDDEEYKSYIWNKIFNIKKKHWRKVLEEGARCRNNLTSILKQMVPKQNADLFTNYFYETLKQPVLPIAKLKRETIICNTHTIFQSKLSEVLYEDSGMISKGLRFADENKGVIDSLQEMEKKIQQELLLADKNEILKARWYMNDYRDCESEETLSNCDKSDSLIDLVPQLSRKASEMNSSEETQILRNLHHQSFLLNFYDGLCQCITHHCTIVSDYLLQIENVYDLLCEYTARWKTYVCSMLELESVLEHFTKLMNDNYENMFQGYPSFPKFSIWRLMTKIWMKEVFERSNLNQSLTESFLRILNNHRDKNVRTALNNNHFNDKSLEDNKEIPKCLYISLNIKKKKHSMIKTQAQRSLINVPHTLYTNNPENEKKLLSNFSQSIMDLSLNEVNIHYLDCSDMPTSYPYHEMEDSFLLKSKDFYTEYEQIFNESPSYFYHFLKADYALMTEVLTERTKIKLESIQIKIGIDFISQFIRDQVQQMTPKDLEEINKQDIHANDAKDEVDDFIEKLSVEIFDQVQRDLKYTSPSKDFYCNIPSVEEDDCIEPEEKQKSEIQEQFFQQAIKDPLFIQKLMSYFEQNSKNIRSNFEYLKERFEKLEKVKEEDDKIRFVNTDKNIPADMSDVDSLFYDLEKFVDISLLTKMHNDYKQMIAEQEKAQQLNNQGQEEDDEGQEMQTQKDDPMSQYLQDDEDDEGLPELTQPSLKMGRSTTSIHYGNNADDNNVGKTISFERQESQTMKDFQSQLIREEKKYGDDEEDDELAGLGVITLSNKKSVRFEDEIVKEPSYELSPLALKSKNKNTEINFTKDSGIFENGAGASTNDTQSFSLRKQESKYQPSQSMRDFQNQLILDSHKNDDDDDDELAGLGGLGLMQSKKSVRFEDQVLREAPSLDTPSLFDQTSSIVKPENKKMPSFTSMKDFQAQLLAEEASREDQNNGDDDEFAGLGNISLKATTSQRLGTWPSESPLDDIDYIKLNKSNSVHPKIVGSESSAKPSMKEIQQQLLLECGIDDTQKKDKEDEGELDIPELGMTRSKSIGKGKQVFADPVGDDDEDEIPLPEFTTMKKKSSVNSKTNHNNLSNGNNFGNYVTKKGTSKRSNSKIQDFQNQLIMQEGTANIEDLNELALGSLGLKKVKIEEEEGDQQGQDNNILDSIINNKNGETGFDIHVLTKI